MRERVLSVVVFTCIAYVVMADRLSPFTGVS